MVKARPGRFSVFVGTFTSERVHSWPCDILFLLRTVVNMCIADIHIQKICVLLSQCICFD